MRGWRGFWKGFPRMSGNRAAGVVEEACRACRTASDPECRKVAAYELRAGGFPYGVPLTPVPVPAPVRPRGGRAARVLRFLRGQWWAGRERARPGAP